MKANIHLRIQNNIRDNKHNSNYNEKKLLVN